MAATIDIPQKDVDLIMHTKMSILISGGDVWVKKGQDPFDVGMGSYDGAEVADIVGLYLLSQLEHLPMKGGLYRSSTEPGQGDSRTQCQGGG